MLDLNYVFKSIRNNDNSIKYLQNLPIETLQLGLDSWNPDKKNNPGVTEAVKTIQNYLCGCYILQVFADKSPNNMSRNSFDQHCTMRLKEFPNALIKEEKTILENLINDKPIISSSVSTKIIYGSIVRKFDEFITDQQK